MATKQKNRYADVFSDKDLGEHVEEAKENQANAGKFAVYMDIDDGEEAEVRFIEKDPVKFWQHRVFDSHGKKGKGGYRVFSCTRTHDCPLCVAGDKPTFKVAWQIVHVDNLDKNGNVTPRVKLFVKGIRFAEYYNKKSEKKDLTSMNIILERTGSGQNTQYTFADYKEKSKAVYDEEELVDLEEYFGLDDEKFADMERIAEGLSASSQEYKGPKQGKKSRHEDDEDDPVF